VSPLAGTIVVVCVRALFFFFPEPVVNTTLSSEAQDSFVIEKLRYCSAFFPPFLVKSLLSFPSLGAGVELVIFLFVH